MLLQRGIVGNPVARKKAARWLVADEEMAVMDGNIAIFQRQKRPSQTFGDSFNILTVVFFDSIPCCCVRDYSAPYHACYQDTFVLALPRRNGLQEGRNRGRMTGHSAQFDVVKDTELKGQKYGAFHEPLQASLWGARC